MKMDKIIKFYILGKKKKKKDSENYQMRSNMSSFILYNFVYKIINTN